MSGLFIAMSIMSICAYALFILCMKIIGSTQKENSYKSTEEAISRDTNEFNKF